MVYTNNMTDDGTRATTTPSPQPQSQSGSTVFEQPTSGFLASDDGGVSNTAPPIYEDFVKSRPQSVTAQPQEQAPSVDAYVPPRAQVSTNQATTSTTNTQPSQQNQQNTTQTQDQAQAASTQQQAQDDFDELDYSGYFPDALRPQPEELLYAWEAPSRPFKKHNRNYYTTIAVIVLLISLILIFAGQFVPMAVVCAVAFMIYVINSVPPQKIEYAITTYGVRIGEKLYYWDLMTRFWYDSKYDQKLLQIQIVEFPERLTLVVGEAKQEILTSIFSELLLLEKPPLSVYERIAKWLQEKFPLDLDS